VPPDGSDRLCRTVAGPPPSWARGPGGPGWSVSTTRPAVAGVHPWLCQPAVSRALDPRVGSTGGKSGGCDGPSGAWLTASLSRSVGPQRSHPARHRRRRRGCSTPHEARPSCKSPAGRRFSVVLLAARIWGTRV
jgi:hypothetical protein